MMINNNNIYSFNSGRTDGSEDPDALPEDAFSPLLETEEPDEARTDAQTTEIIGRVLSGMGVGARTVAYFSDPHWGGLFRGMTEDQIAAEIGALVAAEGLEEEAP